MGGPLEVGLAHARKTAEVIVDADTCQITVEPGITITAPRTTSRDIRRQSIELRLMTLVPGSQSARFGSGNCAREAQDGGKVLRSR